MNREGERSVRLKRDALVPGYVFSFTALSGYRCLDDQVSRLWQRETRKVTLNRFLLSFRWITFPSCKDMCHLSFLFFYIFFTSFYCSFFRFWNTPVSEVRKSVVLYESWMDSFEGGKIKSRDKNYGVEVFMLALWFKTRCKSCPKEGKVFLWRSS